MHVSRVTGTQRPRASFLILLMSDIAIPMTFSLSYAIFHLPGTACGRIRFSLLESHLLHLNS